MLCQKGKESVFGTNYDLKKLIIFSKDTQYFTGKTNQSFNQLRRALIGTNTGLKNTAV